MVGNVWGWVSETTQDGVVDGITLPDQGYVTSIDDSGIVITTSSRNEEIFDDDYFWIERDGLRGMIRGGYWKSGTDAGVYALNAGIPTTFLGTGVGFRCVK